MDINEILNSLGIDLTNPEAKRGAIEAIQAILSSRVPPMDISGGGGGAGMAPGAKIDVEIDPDLLQPSRKFGRQGGGDDIEIEDEEDILGQIKHNEPEDELYDDTEGSEKNSSSSSSDDGSTDKDSSASSDSETDVKDVEDIEQPVDKPKTSDVEPDSSDEPKNSDELEANEEGTDPDKEETPEAMEEDELEKRAGASGEEDAIEAEEEPTEEAPADEEDEDLEDESEEETEPEEDEFEFDEDDILDSELKNSYDDKGLNAKREARRIKRERTLAAARTALEKAKARNVSQALIRELEKSIEALESLTEAKAKNLADISDEEFNLLVNRVFDAISAVGDTDLTFTSEEEREMKAQEIKTDLGSRETQQALSDEDIAAIRAETQAVKAREKETAIYKRPARNSFKGFQEFLNSLYRAIALQVQTNEVQDDTWSAINRRYSGTGVLKQGQRKNDLPDKKIPVIDFYFDCSGSWGDPDIAVGKRAVSTLVDMEEKGQIKINIYYFSNHVFNDIDSARAEGGTRAWNEIVKNVIATQATNVIIMTDSDMEDRWSGPTALKYTVPGYVWYLWRDGDNAPRLPRDLKGRGGVQQFSFSRGDV